MRVTSFCPQVRASRFFTCAVARRASRAAFMAAPVLLPRDMHDLRERTHGADTLRVCTFNLLADGLAQNGGFIRCPADALSWETRKPLLLAELARCHADVVCLQEVNRLAELMDSLPGYTAAFLPKRFSPCTELGFPGDGVALLYAPARLEPLSEPHTHGFVLADGSASPRGVLLQAFVDKSSSRALVVACTHLKAKNFDDVREAEATQVLAELERFVVALGRPCDVLLCGDFNTVLDSPALRAVLAHTPRRLQNVQFPPGHFTTWKWRGSEGGAESEKKLSIDHIFYSEGLRPVSLLSAPADDAVGPGALPCARYGSDHLAQLAVFEVAPHA